MALTTRWATTGAAGFGLSSPDTPLLPLFAAADEGFTFRVELSQLIVILRALPLRASRFP